MEHSVCLQYDSKIRHFSDAGVLAAKQLAEVLSDEVEGAILMNRLRSDPDLY
jgi:hypothetical protein